MSALFIGAICLTSGLVLGYVLREAWARVEVRRSRRRASLSRYARSRRGALR